VQTRTPTRGWRIALKGVSDTFEYLQPFIVASITWWIGCATIVLAPAATRALFRVADPRVISNLERPAVWGALRHPLGVPGAWKLFAVTVIPIGVLLGNLAFYSASDRGWSLLIPLWCVLLVMFALASLAAWSLLALLDQPAGHALRLSAAITLGRPRQLFSTLLVAAPVVVIGSLLIVPLVLFMPALVAAISNRFTLEGLDIAIPDPLEPSEERRIEELQEADRKKLGP
jgi:hypothetical protein